MTGTNGTEYQFVTELPIATTTYSDSLSDTQLGEVLPSGTWYPPVDGLSGIVDISSGMLAGFSGKDVWISEPFIPHGWPNRKSVNYNIVALSSYGTSLVCLTEGTPYLASGTDPSALSLEKVEFEQACVSARGVVRIGDSGIMYPSPDGLCMIGTAGIRVATQDIMRRAEWQTFKPESIHGYFHDQQYFGFYDTGSVQGGFIFDLRDGGFRTHDTYATAGFADPKTDALYLIVGGSLVKWEGDMGNLKTYTWKSKQFEFGSALNFGWSQIIARDYLSLTCRVWADGVNIHTQTVTSGNPFRLPGGFAATVWEVELLGTSVVQSAILAGSLEELL